MRKRLTGLLGGRSTVNETQADDALTRTAAGQAAPPDVSEDYGEGPTRLHRPFHALPDAVPYGGEDPTRPNRGRLNAVPVTTSAEAPTRPRDRRPGARIRLGRQQILVAAHDGLVVLDLSQILQQSGYRVVGAATTAEEVFELAAESRPDLVVIDVHLRGALTGMDAAREIQRRSGVPVILLASAGDRVLLDAAPAFQPAAVVRKPHRAADLLAAVAAAILPPVYDDPSD